MQEFHASKYLSLTRNGQIHCGSPLIPQYYVCGAGDTQRNTAGANIDDSSLLNYRHTFSRSEYLSAKFQEKQPDPRQLLPVSQASPTHVDLLRTDSGNSSLSNIDSVSNSSTTSQAYSLHSTSFEPNTGEDFCCQPDDIILVNVYIPELQSEFDITCSRNQSIWRVKIILIEQNETNLKDCLLNYGLFTFVYELFLDEQLTFADYFSADRFNLSVIKLEFLYKQRIKFGEVMSTLPLASNTRKKRKRSRLLSAIQNCNLDKIAKSIVNCDPNFVDEATGETPLSLASASQSANTNLQQIIVAIVNGGALLDFRTKDGRTALHVAVQKSNFVALKTLLDLGASPNYLDANGLTPLYYSVIYKANPKLTQLLLYEHATHGITDQHGWQEVHHASKLGLVTHLEQLLFYGCDMNCRIVGSGNTSLHVAAINDQMECARVLLLRGCDTSIVNNSHQNAYQVAVIASNMALADMIKNHKPENIVQYRDKPRYNPARRPQNHHTDKSCKPSELNGHSSGHLSVRPTSPSLSQTTNNTTTTSSGVCCEDDDDDAKKNCQESNVKNGNNENNEDDEDCEDEDEDDEEEAKSSESEDSATFLPGMTVRAVADYNSGDPSHLQLRRNDNVLLLHSEHSPPTIAFQKLLLGRRTADNKEGFFPACCVEKIKHSKYNGDDGERVEGRRDMKMKVVQSATLPTRGRRGARKCLLDKGVTRQYQERTVILQRGSKGFGFVLRGAKDSSPILTKQLMQQGSPMPLIGLQYFDEIESGGVADAAGLKRGDFLLAVNDVDVRHMSHENVVLLIRQSGDKVTMTIATAVPKQLVSILKKKGRTNKPQQEGDKPVNGTTSESLPSSQSQTQMSQSVYSSFNNKAKAPPPAPPKRDPSTMLTTTRARARSLVVPSEVRSAHNQTMMMMMDEAKTAVDCNNKTDFDDTLRHQINNQNTVASIRSRQTSKRISSYELNEFSTNQSDDSKTKFEELQNKKPSANESNSVHEVVKSQASKDPTLSPPSSSPQTSIKTSIVKVTLAKPQKHEYLNYESNKSTDTASRSLTSFQPARSTNSQSDTDKDKCDAAPQIPEPDYSSDEEENKTKSETVPNGNVDHSKSVSGKSENDAADSSQSHQKLTTTATLILKSSSPCPPEATTSTVNTVTETSKNGLFSSKNMFEELREQSAKITSAARLRFAANRQNSTDDKCNSPQLSAGDPSAPVNNVMKNVAEFERRLSITGENKSEAAVCRPPNQPEVNGQNNSLRMSKSCIEEFVPNNVTLRKDYSTLTKSSLKQHSQQQQQESRRNSAIISAIAEKVAAVNQLVAEQQQSTGTKSLNSSPIPSTLSKMPVQIGSTVVVQKPIAVLPSGASATLNRRCVTVCEDPVKNIHLQQQHQQLRSQLAGQMMASQMVRPKHSSLAESTSSILKQTSKAVRSTPPANIAYGSGTNSPIDLVPPPPEFAAASPNAQAVTSTSHHIPPNLRQTVTAQQKAYVQRQLQSSTTSPLTLQTNSAGVPIYHHHHQLVSDVLPHYGQQGHHYHVHHNHGQVQQSVSLSSSAPTNSDTMALMRSSLSGSSQPSQPGTLTNYSDYSGQVISQNKAAQLVNAHHAHHTAAQQAGHIYSQQQQQQQQPQQSSQQQQSQNQLILQQRAIAVANAKLLQQQQQIRSQSVGQYNTLGSSKPQQIQYYVTSQNQQNPQYFATLSRHQHAQVMQQYLDSLPSHQQQMQQQQFATLTRHHQQQLQQHLQPALQQSINYSQLLQQRQSQQQQQQQQTQQQLNQTLSMPVNTRLVQVQSLGNRQTPPPVGTKLAHQYSTGSATGPYAYQPAAATIPAASYARKSVVEWTTDDVQEWLSRIGMAEHRAKFECFNGAKMIRLDNNSLSNIGVRQQQHRIYILEKLKQQIWQNHQ